MGKTKKYTLYVYIYIWCIARFSISHFFAVCIIARTHTRARMLAPFLPSCHFYSFVWVNMAFLRIYHMLNVRMPFKRVNIKQFSDVWMFLPYFKVSWGLKCNVILHSNSSCALENIIIHMFLVIVFLSFSPKSISFSWHSVDIRTLAKVLIMAAEIFPGASKKNLIY